MTASCRWITCRRWVNLMRKAFAWALLLFLAAVMAFQFYAARIAAEHLRYEWRPDPLRLTDGG